MRSLPLITNQNSNVVQVVVLRLYLGFPFDFWWMNHIASWRRRRDRRLCWNDYGTAEESGREESTHIKFATFEKPYKCRTFQRANFYCLLPSASDFWQFSVVVCLAIWLQYLSYLLHSTFSSMNGFIWNCLRRELNCMIFFSLIGMLELKLITSNWLYLGFERKIYKYSLILLYSQYSWYKSGGSVGEVTVQELTKEAFYYPAPYNYF